MAPETKRSAWTLATVLIIAVVCGINIVHTARKVPPAARPPDGLPPNPVMRHEQRFARVRVALEARGVRGTIGYLADLPADQLASDARAMEDYFLSQFALVPWVLDPRFDQGGWVVANLRSAKAEERVPQGFHIARDCGAGVLLLRKAAP